MVNSLLQLLIILQSIRSIINVARWNTGWIFCPKPASKLPKNCKLYCYMRKNKQVSFTLLSKFMNSG